MFSISQTAILVSEINDKTQIIEISSATFSNKLINYIMIGHEIISYEYTDGNILYQIKRGQFGTNSYNHMPGETVNLIVYEKTKFTLNDDLLNFEISVHSRNVIESNTQYDANIEVSLSEPLRLKVPVVVNYETNDITAASDLSVKALAYDDLGNPFITVIDNSRLNRRVYIDGSFPKWYNLNYSARLDDLMFLNTLKLSINIINWLANGKNNGKVLLLGNLNSVQYNVKYDMSIDQTGFKDYWQDAVSSTGRILDIEYVQDIDTPTLSSSYFLQYDCVIYISSFFTSDQIQSENFLEQFKNAHLSGLGFAAIGDHVDEITSFSKGINEILEYIYSVSVIGSIDRQNMIITAEDMIAEYGDHPIWHGISGRINSNGSEAYVNANNSEPDYISKIGNVIFNVGDIKKYIPITILNNTEVESDKEFKVKLLSSNYGIINNNESIVTIKDLQVTSINGLATTINISDIMLLYPDFGFVFNTDSLLGYQCTFSIIGDIITITPDEESITNNNITGVSFNVSNGTLSESGFIKCVNI